PLSPTELRAHLVELLPDFMVPNAYVSLPVLPVTANGKLDRRALPAPENRRPELVQPYLAPITGTEDRVCCLFAELLGLDKVGRLDNFFELGGNSLLVMRVLSRLQQETQHQLSATVFFYDPTPGALAGMLDGHAGTAIPSNRLSHRRSPEE